MVGRNGKKIEIEIVQGIWKKVEEAFFSYTNSKLFYYLSFIMTIYVIKIIFFNRFSTIDLL